MTLQVGTSLEKARPLQASGNLEEVWDAAQARANLGLGNVDNTSDADKPVSTAAQDALDNKQNKAVTFGTVERTVEDKLNEAALAPEDFGAVGDGVTDDYAAFQALVAAVNAAGGGTIRPGRGKTYFLGQHIVAGNGVSDLTFADCNGLTIEGNGAKIDIDGNFDRDALTTYALSILFDECSNLTIRDLEIDGNVDQSTNSGGAVEAGATGIHLRGCTDVVIENVHSHHHQRDGLLIRDTSGAPFIVSKRVTVRNSRFLYNARQGASLTGLRGATFDNCDFSWTARAAGTYGGHSPKSGVDVEPSRSTGTVPATDADTGDITFLNCRFEENLGTTITCGNGNLQDNVKLIGCTLRVGGGAAATIAGIIGARGCVIRDCDIDIGTNDNSFYVWPDATNLTGDVTIVGNRFVGAGRFIRANAATSGRILVESNSFIANGTAPYSGFLWDVPGGTATDVQFRNNKMFIAKEMYIDGGGSDFHSIFRMSSGVSVAEGNRFSTDLLAASGSSGTAHYCQSYNAATTVRNEKFTGAAPGVADTFRPSTGSAFDTTRAYSSAPLTSTAGIGYDIGAGGTVTQLTNKSNGVTLNKTTGEIRMNNAALAANTSVSFTLTNNQILSADDEVSVWVKLNATAGAYLVMVDQVAAGSCRVHVRNVSGAPLSEAIRIGFSVRRSAVA